MCDEKNESISDCKWYLNDQINKNFNFIFAL